MSDEQLALAATSMPTTAIDLSVDVVAEIRRYLEARTLTAQLDPAESRPTDALDRATDAALVAADRVVDVTHKLVKHLVSLGPPEATKRPDDDDEFMEFWQMYGRVGPRSAAWKAWTKARKSTPAREIIDGLERWVAYWLQPGAANVKWPQGWLNERRWEDEPPTKLLAVSGRPQTRTGSVLAGMRQRAEERARQRGST